MQGISPLPVPPESHLTRKFVYFFSVPASVTILLALLFVLIVSTYQARHRNQIFTGVSVGQVDLSGMSREEAETAVSRAFPYPNETAITFMDTETGQQWTMTPAELGLSFNTTASIDAAFDVGRQGQLPEQLQTMFSSWYYGRSLSPVLVLDEGQLNTALTQLAAEVAKPAANARLDEASGRFAYSSGQTGRQLNTIALRASLLPALTDFRQAQIELPIMNVPPTINDDAETAVRIQQIVSEDPITFYLQEPLADIDLGRVTLTGDGIQRWIRAEVVELADGALAYNVFLDETAVRQWLEPFAVQLYREPVNARYYYDDLTQELVLIAPHINGRELDIDATIAQLNAQVGTPNRSVPFIMKEIIPTANSNATAEELGITELISERTTWFFGSSDARKRNIARSAANFYGIVIAPGEEFSFNKYLGTISEDDGYEEGLIIIGGQTIKGIGGGVCQVSTTVFQTVFYAGFPVTERWQHGYMLGYYNDGEGPGMDATVYSPIVDFKFVNNTPYHLLIENYYNEVEESLTFKFYSTSMGRTVEKSGPVFENIVPAPSAAEDVWTFDPELEAGTVNQIDWATEGAKVTVGRTVYNADGEVIIQEDFVSNYIPWPNGYMYGSGVNAPDYSLVPRDN
ncbi:MAG: VanW family protein [Ardenticatenaceae bacterium]|nr:MAG: VanW family protein [Ardenticatenaceae bacterium]